MYKNFKAHLIPQKAHLVKNHFKLNDITAKAWPTCSQWNGLSTVSGMAVIESVE